MKKKFMLIGIMLVICFGILFGIKSIQKTPVASEVQNNSVVSDNTAKTEVQKEENKQEENKDNQTLTAGENSTKNSTASNVESNTGKTQEQNKANETKPAAKANTAASNSTVNSKTETNNNTKIDTQKPVEQKPNLIITNTITGDKILNIKADFEGVTAAEATQKALDSAGKSYKISGLGESVYFSSINGLRERGAGASSGWCYYVNGKKLNVSSGTYSLNKGDILEWKYLKDGVSN
ncbi:hypothetical protein HMPREF1982_04086 [Clostridiales bacterium oral taxon 876 str. F0540]|nr:hypothetical protein HMPREF1982_04086 [Clostridiales bacterium oral taxon 876 str. F0540]